MATYKLSIADPQSGKTFKFEVTGHHADAFTGQKIGTELDGLNCNLPGFKVAITGGTDGAGFPMRPDFDFAGRRRLLLTFGTGFKPTDYNGKRFRKMVCGNVVTPEIVQLNLKITKHGSKDPAELFGALEEANA